MSVLLLQLQTVAERFPDDFSNDTVGIEGRIKNDRAEFAQVNFSIRQDGFVCLGSHDFANQIAGFHIP